MVVRVTFATAVSGIANRKTEFALCLMNTFSFWCSLPLLLTQNDESSCFSDWIMVQYDTWMDIASLGHGLIVH